MGNTATLTATLMTSMLLAKAPGSELGKWCNVLARILRAFNSSIASAQRRFLVRNTFLLVMCALSVSVALASDETQKLLDGRRVNDVLQFSVTRDKDATTVS